MVGRAATPAEERFFEKVKKGDGCWEWQANKNNKGYGIFRYKRGLVLAHRFSYEITRGAIPKGKWALHTCDNRACVNPDHVFIGTHADNMHDMHSKGRGRSILNPTKAAEIKRRREAGERRGLLAAEYGVSVSTIKNISMGRSWADHMGGYD